MHPAKLKNILSQSDEQRYQYFVGKIADFEEVWSLRSNRGWVSGQDAQGRVYIPFWPEKEFAEAGKLKGWENGAPEAIPLDVFTERWIPGMTREGQWACIFPVPNGDAIVIQPNFLKEDIDQALDQIG